MRVIGYRSQLSGGVFEEGKSGRIEEHAEERGGERGKRATGTNWHQLALTGTWQQVDEAR